jgi:hypothetical protein
MKKFYLSLIIAFSSIVTANCQGIISAEYFFDTDPGAGHGTAITITFNDTISTNNIPVNTAGLINGYHYLYVRAKERNGTWGHCRRQRFYIFDNNPITIVRDSIILKHAEYWIAGNCKINYT